RAPAKSTRAAPKAAARPAANARPVAGAPKPIGRLRAHRREIAGVGLLLLAGLGGLGIWLGVAGVAGDALTFLAGSAVGPGLDGWRRAGGVLGAAVGHPLRSLAGPWGAGLVLAALAFVGSLILFRLSFDQVWRALRRAAVAVGHALGGGLRRLTTLSGS